MAQGRCRHQARRGGRRAPRPGFARSGWRQPLAWNATNCSRGRRDNAGCSPAVVSSGRTSPGVRPSVFPPVCGGRSRGSPPALVQGTVDPGSFSPGPLWLRDLDKFWNFFTSRCPHPPGGGASRCQLPRRDGCVDAVTPRVSDSAVRSRAVPESPPSTDSRLVGPPELRSPAAARQTSQHLTASAELRD